MSVLSWLDALIRWLCDFVPRVWHLECTDIAVYITRGTRIRILAPGLHVYWPFWTSMYHRAATTQTVNLPTQALITHDNRQVVAGGMVRYCFARDDESVTKALVETDDVESALTDDAMAVFCAFITSKTLRELQGERAKVNRSLTGKLSTQLATYGVEVMRAQLTDFSPCITLNHVGRVAQDHLGEGTDE